MAANSAFNPAVLYRSYVTARPPSLSKIVAILKAAPLYLQTEIVSLVPYILDETEHTWAAGALLDLLARVVQEAPAVEVQLRLAVFTALGQLKVQPGASFQAF